MFIARQRSADDIDTAILSVRPSVTLRYHIETAEYIAILHSPCGRSIILVFQY